jgi:hypothetical protein
LVDKRIPAKSKRQEESGGPEEGHFWSFLGISGFQLIEK